LPDATHHRNAKDPMPILDEINAGIITAMKAHDDLPLQTLRMVKSAIKSKEIDKRAPLTDAESVQTLTTLIKQRRESAEAFTKGNRPELAAKELEEITIIERYLPKAAGNDEIIPLVAAARAELEAAGTKLTPRDMGTLMKAVQAKIAAAQLRADGKAVSELVKTELAK
jgi:uncharacterized protein YqeY